MKLTYACSVSEQNFDRDAAERVIRRAINLDDAAAPAAPDRVSEMALSEAAEELGIDVTAVRRAAAEERLGMLRDKATVSDRLVGPSTLLAVHPFEAPATEAFAAVDGWLTGTGGFRRVRLAQHGEVYHRRKDPMAKAQRAVRSVSGRESLEAGITEVVLIVEPLDRESSLVGFVVDRTLGQKATLVSSGFIGGAGSLGSGLMALGPGPWPLWFGVPASALVATGIVAGRRAALRETDSNLNAILGSIARADGRSGRSAGESAVAGVADLITRGSSLRRALFKPPTSPPQRRTR